MKAKKLAAIGVGIGWVLPEIAFITAVYLFALLAVNLIHDVHAGIIHKWIDIVKNKIWEWQLS
jgi:hypothetical protein